MLACQDTDTCHQIAHTISTSMTQLRVPSPSMGRVSASLTESSTHQLQLVQLGLVGGGIMHARQAFPRNYRFLRAPASSQKHNHRHSDAQAALTRMICGSMCIYAHACRIAHVPERWLHCIQAHAQKHTDPSNINILTDPIIRWS